ncbi:hypothetical protein BJY01DRAFT_231521 [Aspergillus pseudoustus]|uniref:AB hydrolase-1 domain-containing protein n=1 Tax=Aspergillus pseudoustus TaxID=1810923 RepID=A0ABR4KXA2_9EURO
MKEDIVSIRNHIETVVSQGEDVLLVLHSAGGFIGSEAMKGLGKAERTQNGHEGGVVSIVFIAGAVYPEGHEHKAPPFAIGGALHCAQPEKLLFGDLPDDEKATWLAAIRPQPSRGWEATVEYAGWKHVPSVYLICEGDNALPVPLQEQLAALAGSRVERCSTGHLPQLSQPEKVVEVIERAVSGGLWQWMPGLRRFLE